MKTKKVLRYYSDCGRGFWKKQLCINHEENCKCWTNPKNRACKTCKHAEFEAYEEDTGSGGFWSCLKVDEHSGAPFGVDYISANCVKHEL